MAEATSRRGGRLTGLIPMVVVGIIVVLFARSCIEGFTFGGDDKPDDADPMDVFENGEGEGDDESADTTLPDLETPEGAALLEAREPECPDEEGEPERHLQWTEPPPMCVDSDNEYTAVLETSRGDIEIELDTENAPATVNNFVFLARWGFYDGVDFHIVLPGQSAQAGFHSGSDEQIHDPGYTYEDEFLPEGEDPPYPLYSVAMGNSGPDTNGSVFFIISGTEAEREPVYSRFGIITDEESQAVVDEIDSTGVRRAGHDGSPRQGEETTIRTVTITES